MSVSSSHGNAMSIFFQGKRHFEILFLQLCLQWTHPKLHLPPVDTPGITHFWFYLDLFGFTLTQRNKLKMVSYRSDNRFNKNVRQEEHTCEVTSVFNTTGQSCLKAGLMLRSSWIFRPLSLNWTPVSALYMKINENNSAVALAWSYNAAPCCCSAATAAEPLYKVHRLFCDTKMLMTPRSSTKSWRTRVWPFLTLQPLTKLIPNLRTPLRFPRVKHSWVPLVLSQLFSKGEGRGVRGA